MNSFNHYSLGSCVEWLYSHVLGIKLFEDGSVCISPSFSQELTFAEGEYKSRNGRICVEWKYADGIYHVRVESEKGVQCAYNFEGKEVLSLHKEGNVLVAKLR